MSSKHTETENIKPLSEDEIDPVINALLDVVWSGEPRPYIDKKADKIKLGIQGK